MALIVANRGDAISTRAIISVTQARASYYGPGLNLAPHRNAATTLVIALEGTFQLELFPAGSAIERREGQRIALVPGGMRHHLVCAGTMAFIYLDASSLDVAAICDHDLLRRLPAITGAGAGAWAGWSADDWCLALGLPARHKDRRILAVADILGMSPDHFTNVADAAGHAGLSPSRFQALFTATMGSAFRQWRSWCRLTVAVTRLAEGASLTRAAHDAGFASSAHFSTRFRAMFGLSPSMLLKIGADIRIAPDFAVPRDGPRMVPVRQAALANTKFGAGE